MKRPYVIVNVAMSADGKIALPSRRQTRISCEEDIARMYQLRNDCDAVLVGVGTILSDDPKLTVKEKYVENPRQPLRVVFDSQGRTPPAAQVVNDTAQTVIFTAKGKKTGFIGSHVEVIGCSTEKNGFIDVKEALHLLHERGVRKLLVEGGGTIIWCFLRNKVVDELMTYIGPRIIGGIDSPTVADGEGIVNENDAIVLKIIDVQRLGEGVLIRYVMS
jgi:2,5-diamino-6-(ribosylamino)-4(3H)-pyrimidinone 5'-phosphate reductase